MRKPAPPPLDRRGAMRVASERTKVPAYSATWDLTRGKCRKPRCASRWGVTRVTLDFRPVAIERFASVECVRCGTVWRRVRVPALRDGHGYQTVAVTAILPASVTRWFSRGRWHRDGDDALVVPECSLADLDEAARAHRKLSERVAAVKARRVALKQERERVAGVEMRDLLARLAAHDAERAEAEAEAERRAA